MRKEHYIIAQHPLWPLVVVIGWAITRLMPRLNRG